MPLTPHNNQSISVRSFDLYCRQAPGIKRFQANYLSEEKLAEYAKEREKRFETLFGTNAPLRATEERRRAQELREKYKFEQ